MNLKNKVCPDKRDNFKIDKYNIDISKYTHNYFLFDKCEKVIYTFNQIFGGFFI